MKTSLIRDIIDRDKLIEEIVKFEATTNQMAYLFMGRTTIDYLVNKMSLKASIADPNYISTDVIAIFHGRNVYINDDLKFGEVEIR